MDPLSVPVSPTAPAPDVLDVLDVPEEPKTDSVTVIELNDKEYCKEVLQLPLGKSEAQADEELLARASAVGITATLPSLASQCPPTSSWSDSSFGTPQQRSFSNISNKTNGTGVSTQSSAFCPPSPLFDSEGGERRSSTSSLTFAHYERYISAIDSGNNDGKPAKDPLPIYNFTPKRVFIPSPKSMASASSKKSSFQAIKERLFGRKKKKKVVQLPLPPPPVVEIKMYVFSPLFFEQIDYVTIPPFPISHMLIVQSICGSIS